TRALRIHRDMVHAVSNFSVWIGNVFRIQAFVDGLPTLAAIIGAEGARGRDRDVYAVRIFRIENDGVQAHSTCSGLPFGSGAMTAQSGQFFPVLAPIRGLK